MEMLLAIYFMLVEVLEPICRASEPTMHRCFAQSDMGMVGLGRELAH
jgi:hypothetical protein